MYETIILVIKERDELQHVMVRLTYIRHTENQYSRKPRWWPESKFTKINICMGLLFVSGLWSFVFVRDNVMKQRKQQMKLKKEVEIKVRKEVEEEAAAAGDKQKKINY